MAKKDNSLKFKGIIDVYDDYPFIRITEFEKKGQEVIEKPYNVFDLLKEFNSKEVSFSVAESISLEPTEE